MANITKSDLDTFDFDLESALSSIVSLRSVIPEDAMTARVLGTERAGHGVVLAPDGEVLTIGYLVTEAESVWLSDQQGRACPGYVLGYDQETGFGLVKPLQAMGWPTIELGDSSTLAVDDRVIVAGHGGMEQVVSARLIAKREFAGYWEYVLDEALFTAPAHPNWGGAALLNDKGQLCGIGSLLVQTIGDEGEPEGANMVVPINLLKPIIEDLRSYGRQNKPARPWLGWLVQDLGDELVVAGTHDGGPANAAGLQVGDVVLEIDGEPVDNLADMFRAVWHVGPAGVGVPIAVLRGGERQQALVQSVDRTARLKSAAVH